MPYLELFSTASDAVEPAALPDGLAGTGRFADAQPTPGDATAIDRLAAFLGGPAGSYG